VSTLASTTPTPPPAPALLPEDDRYEIVDGKRVELPPMSAYASVVASRLHLHLGAWVLGRDLGAAVQETLFQFPAPVSRNRRPDVAFVSYQRWPKGQAMAPAENAWPVVPDLAAEVVSPTDYTEDLLERVQEYFRVGVSLVWVVYPLRRAAQVYDSLAKIRGLTDQDDLDGGTVLPGLRVPLQALFD
jgi:Uma2 family endonuclease